MNKTPINKPPCPTNASAQDLLDVSDIRSELNRAAVRGGVATALSQFTRAVARIIAIAVLARQLSPGDFGLLAMATTVVGFASIIKDLGLTTAVIQRQSISQAEVANLFWVNIAVGLFLSFFMILAAPFAAQFYNDGRLESLLVVLSCIFTIDALGAQHQAVLRRRMDFKKVAIIEVMGVVGGTLGAIVVGFLSKSYWALVVTLLLNSIIVSIALWTACAWRPSRSDGTVSVRPLISFGIHLAGFNLINYVFRNLDNILIGRFWGAASLGVYSNAYSLLMLPITQINGPITTVALPALSRLSQEPEAYVSFYKRGLSSVVMLGMPVVVFLVVEADSIASIVFGGRWVGVSDVFQALGAAAFIGTFNVATGWVYVSTGAVKRQLIAGIANSLVSAAFIVGGLQYGIMGVAYAISISMMLTRIPSLLYCFNGTPVTIVDFISAVWHSAVSSIVAGMAIVLINPHVKIISNEVIQVLFSSVLYAIAYVSVICSLPFGLEKIMHTLRLRNYLRSN